MGFNEARRRLLAALDVGRVQHEMRADIDVKNLLFSGEVSISEIKAGLRQSSGRHYTCSRHHRFRSIPVHILKLRRGVLKHWYLKWYFLEPDAWFISVHMSEFR